MYRLFRNSEIGGYLIDSEHWQFPECVTRPVAIAAEKSRLGLPFTSHFSQAKLPVAETKKRVPSNDPYWVP